MLTLDRRTLQRRDMWSTILIGGFAGVGLFGTLAHIAPIFSFDYHDW